MAKAKKSTPNPPIEEQILNLGKRIKQLRKEKGFTNYEFFAYENRIGRSQYGKYEQGVDMQFSSILRIIEMNGITIKEFFEKGFE